MSGEHEIKLMCETFSVSRSGYYGWLRSDLSVRAQKERALREQIVAVHALSRETYGSPRVTAALRAQGTGVGRNRVARLMRKAGLRGRQKSRFRVVTTDSKHTEAIAPNRLAAEAAPTKANQVWMSDLTYVPTAEGWLYMLPASWTAARAGWSAGPWDLAWTHRCHLQRSRWHYASASHHLA
jgi:transposase InsO family protein